jgi:peptidoglycan hydrolase-like protein with peptidoglycan-binding domain
MRVAAIIVGLAVAGLPVFASAVPAYAKAHKPAAEAAAAANKAEAKGHAGKGKHAASGPTPAAAMAAYAAMPEAERLAIQADLAWVDAYEGGAGGDFDDKTIAAVRTFQSRNSGKATGILTAQERDLLATAAKSREDNVGWRVIEDTATGARLGVPEKLAPRADATRLGSRFTSAQGQVRIETFRLAEGSLPALFEEEKKSSKREVHGSTLKPQSFVISGVQGLKNFIVRAEASGSEVRGVTVLYDQATEGIMGPVAVAIADSFAGFPDPNAAPPGIKRTVDYATAIVVGAAGDLIAPAAATDACHSITVAGLGSAERVAADATAGIALLRVYGVRDLVAVPLAGAAAKDGDVTLLGIPDPIAQAGGAAVTKVTARLSAPTIEPAPPPGFAGAAVMDAQGHFLGVLGMKPLAVAGNVPAGRQATLISSDSVRAWLSARGVEPAAAADRTAIEPAVLRVICVRR